MVIGLPHFSQAMPVCTGGAGLPLASASPMYLHPLASVHCTYGLPVLLNFSRSCLPHCGQGDGLGSWLTTGLPSAPTFMMTTHSGAPSQVKNVPKRPSRLTIFLPQAGHGMSVTSGPMLSLPSSPRLYGQGFSSSFQPLHPMNWAPVLRLNMASSGLPHLGQASPISMPFCEGMSVSAFSRDSENGPQNSSSTSRYLLVPVSMPSSSSSKWLVNFRSMILGK